MASPTAHAPHSGPVDQPGEGAYLYARSGIARSATTRSNYVAVQTRVDWIVRDANGNIISTTDLSAVMLHGSLTVTQAINDEPDTCSFTLKPQAAPGLIPQVGQEIRVSWTTGGGVLFHGYVLVAQSDWRVLDRQPAWTAIQCQDFMWRFDARIVTYTFPVQSVTDSILFLVKWFCNNPLGDPQAGTLKFDTTFVQAGMPSIPAFDVVNQRPSTVMRTLLASVAGGFYIEGFNVHAWANSVGEPNQTNPQPLAVGLKTLHAFRRTTDATQLRKRVLVEGRRTQTLIAWPTADQAVTSVIGLPVQDATLWDPVTRYLVRIGTQWADIAKAVSVTAQGASPPQAKTAAAFTPGATTLSMAGPIPALPPAQGWIRVGNQYARYTAYTGTPTTGAWALTLLAASYPYGVLRAPIPIDELVEWVDGVLELWPHGLDWSTPDLVMRGQPTDAPVVTLGLSTFAFAAWPRLEGFVQDGRYSYAGANARALADAGAFRDPLDALEWETDDLNALPGRSQAIAMSSAAVNPAINTTVTILRVQLSFPLRTLPPRRTCTGGIVKTSTFMDLVVTANN